MKTSAGIIFRCEDELLLAHSTNSPWNTWMPPKGHVEEGESHIAAAQRETEEEIGIRVEQSILSIDRSIIVDYDNALGKIHKRVVLFIVDLKSKDFNKNSGVTVVGGLQLEEVDKIEWMNSSQIRTKAQRRYIEPLTKLL
jgi:8-oxo-dGTP pyrophosphatase MutT (NUDIX family)